MIWAGGEGKRWAQRECHIFGGSELKAVSVSVAKAPGSWVLTFSQDKDEK